MEEFLEKVFGVPLKIKLSVGIGIVGAVIGIYVYFFFMPLSTELENLDTSINSLHSEISVRKGLVARLPEATEKVKELDVSLKKALEELPDGRDIPQLLTRVSDKARDAGLLILFFKPMGESRRDFYAEVPVQIQVSGTFHQVATFFDEVGHMERIVNISKYALEDPKVGEDRVTVKTTLVATAFRFLTETEQGNQQKRKKKK